MDFGKVLEAKMFNFRKFQEQMEAKNEKIFGRLKNRIVRLQKQFASKVRRYVRVRGKEHTTTLKKSGVRLALSFSTIPFEAPAAQEQAHRLCLNVVATSRN